MTELYPPVPYVTGATLSRYQGRTVRLLGRPTQSHPTNARFTMQTVDSATITVIRPPACTPLHDIDSNGGGSGWVVVTGVVVPGELTVQENIVDVVEGPVDGAFAKQVIMAMQKMPALFAA